MSGYLVGGSNMGVDDGTFIRCPFNSTHKVLAQRFPYHFVKCKENYPGVEIRHCPYNAKHCFRAEEWQSHLATCPQRGRIDMVSVNLFQSRDDNLKASESMIDGDFTNVKGPHISYTTLALNGELLRQSLARLK